MSNEVEVWMPWQKPEVLRAARKETRGGFAVVCNIDVPPEFTVENADALYIEIWRLERSLPVEIKVEKLCPTLQVRIEGGTPRHQRAVQQIIKAHVMNPGALPVLLSPSDDSEDSRIATLLESLLNQPDPDFELSFERGDDGYLVMVRADDQGKMIQSMRGICHYVVGYMR